MAEDSPWCSCWCLYVVAQPNQGILDRWNRPEKSLAVYMYGVYNS